jgi:hypothetical protein
LLKVTVLILNLICVLLVLIILFSNHIPVTERDGEYWSLNDIAMLDVESNKLSLQALDIAISKGDIEAMEVMFKDRVANFNSSISINNQWGSLISSTSSKLLLCILCLQIILLVRGKVKYNKPLKQDK